MNSEMFPTYHKQLRLPKECGRSYRYLKVSTDVANIGAIKRNQKCDRLVQKIKMNISHFTVFA